MTTDNRPTSMTVTPRRLKRSRRNTAGAFPARATCKRSAPPHHAVVCNFTGRVAAAGRQTDRRLQRWG